MNRPDNHIDRLFREKLTSTEAENPSGADAWARMNALLQTNGSTPVIEEKEEKRGGVIVWFRQYNMAVAAAVLIAFTGIAGLIIIQKNNVNQNTLAIAETEGNSGKETTLLGNGGKTKEGKTAIETKAGSETNNSAAPTNSNPAINGVLPQEVQPVQPKVVPKEKKGSLKKQYPDISRMQTLIAIAERPENDIIESNKNSLITNTIVPVTTTPTFETVAAVVEKENASVANNTSQLDFVMAPVQILYKGSLPTAEQLAAYKTEERGEKVTPKKGSVRNFFASLWRFKNGNGSPTDVKENSKGLYAVFSSSEEE